MKRSANRWGWLFVLIAAAIIISTLMTYSIGQSVIKFDEHIIHQHDVIADLQTIITTLQQAETGQRGFLLTGDELYLQPYTDSIARFQDERAALQELVASGDLNQQSINVLSALIDHKLNELDHTIQIRRQRGLDAALGMVRTNIGLTTMDSIHGQIDRIIAEQEHALREAKAQSLHLTNMRTLTFILTGLTALAFVAWAYVRIGREIQRRDAAAAQAARQKELLAVTLASIGDAVIVTDTGGNITFMNQVAAATTGWSVQEAVGKPCAEVFHIIGEDGRQEVESPVEKVLRLGAVVGLANHTLLIRKDGAEIPIDDSGAPIRRADGTVHGVVLIFRDFSEHKLVEQKLLNAKAEADLANRYKDQFLATLSHELRTPLTPVLAILSLWEASPDLPETILCDVPMLRRNIELEARLIDDLLDLTKIAKGKLSLQLETMDLHELLRSVIDIVKPDLLARTIQLKVELEAADHHVRGDSARLHQVMWNLLKNAAKFTHEDGLVILHTADAAPGRIRITVTDNGIGLSPEMLTRLFQPFEQAAVHPKFRPSGLGLGLAIAKTLVEAHDGTISASSHGPDLGTTFTLEIPTVSALAPILAAPGSSAPRRAAKPLSILLVEDHVDTVKALARLLIDMGHTVCIANSVESALRIAENNAFDLLLTDIGLPDGTGHELLRRLRARGPLPAVALSGFGAEDDLVKSHVAGFDAHLTKPINFRQLHDTLNQMAR